MFFLKCTLSGYVTGLVSRKEQTLNEGGPPCLLKVSNRDFGAFRNPVITLRLDHFSMSNHCHASFR